MPMTHEDDDDRRQGPQNKRYPFKARCSPTLATMLWFPSMQRTTASSHWIILILFCLHNGSLAFPKSSSSERAGSPPSVGLTPTLPFTPNELQEQERAWKFIQTHCIGCWSGTMDSFVSENDFVVRQNTIPERLNFRVQARLQSPEMGLWTVSNRNTRGDSATFPIAKTPTTAFGASFVKLALGDRCLLRLSNAQEYMELGFWQESMRRTVVAYNRDRDENSVTDKAEKNKNTPPGLLLKKLVVLQQRREAPKGFDGLATDLEAIQIMPEDGDEASLAKLLSEPWTVAKIEHVDMDTLERSSGVLEDGTTKALFRAFSHSNLPNMLSNGVCMGVKSSRRWWWFGARTRRTILYGYHFQAEGIFQVIALDYQRNSDQVVRVSNYEFQRQQ